MMGSIILQKSLSAFRYRLSEFFTSWNIINAAILFERIPEFRFPNVSTIFSSNAALTLPLWVHPVRHRHPRCT